MTCERAFAEHLDDAAGVGRADALDEAGAEILLDAFDGVRRHAADRLGLELFAVLAVLYPERPPASMVSPALADGSVPTTVTRPRRRATHAQDREPGVGVVEGDALDRAAEGVGHAGIVTRRRRKNGCQQVASLPRERGR